MGPAGSSSHGLVLGGNHAQGRKGRRSEGGCVEGELARCWTRQGVERGTQSRRDRKGGGGHVNAVRKDAKLQLREKKRHCDIGAEADDGVVGLVDVGEN